MYLFSCPEIYTSAIRQLFMLSSAGILLSGDERRVIITPLVVPTCGSLWSSHQYAREKVGSTPDKITTRLLSLPQRYHSIQVECMAVA